MYIHRWLTCGRDWNDRRGCVCGPMLWAGEFVCSASRRHQCRLESWRQCCQTSENTKNILHHPKWVTVVAFSWGCGETGVLVVPAVAPIHSLVPPPSARKHITLKFRVFFGLSCLKLAEAIMRNEVPKTSGCWDSCCSAFHRSKLRLSDQEQNPVSSWQLLCLVSL